MFYNNTASLSYSDSERRTNNADKMHYTHDMYTEIISGSTFKQLQ